MNIWNHLFLYNQMIVQSAAAVKYTSCFYAEGVNPHPNECPGYMTLNNLMVGFQ